MATAAPTSIRLPTALRDEIRDRARAERRSFSAQVVLMLERSATIASPSIEQDEIEQLATVALDTVRENGGR